MSIPPNVQKIADDLRRVGKPDLAKYVEKESYKDLRLLSYDPDAISLMGLFIWGESPQGHDVWAEANDLIMKIRRLPETLGWVEIALAHLGFLRDRMPAADVEAVQRFIKLAQESQS